MIGYIKGKVLSLKENFILLENNGIGYEVLVSGAAFAKLANAMQGELYTYLQPREDGLFLYGFVSPEEKEVFLKLIKVSGVGPKMAIGILSSMDIKQLAIAIATSDILTLSRCKGVGKKTAEKIIVELREQFAAENVDKEVSKQIPAALFNEDAVYALMSLGFNNNQSVNAVKAAMSNGCKTLEEIIAYALKNIS